MRKKEMRRGICLKVSSFRKDEKSKTYKLEVRWARFLVFKRILWFSSSNESAGVILGGAIRTRVGPAAACVEYSVKMIHEWRAVIFGIAVQSCRIKDKIYSMWLILDQMNELTKNPEESGYETAQRKDGSPVPFLHHLQAMNLLQG